MKMRSATAYFLLFIIVLCLLVLPFRTSSSRLEEFKRSVGLFQESAKEYITIHVDLEEDKVILQLPCVLHKLTKEYLLEEALSSKLHSIPRYSFQIVLQTLEKCQKDSNYQVNIEEVQSFLRIVCPFAEILHEVKSSYLPRTKTNSSYQKTSTIKLPPPNPIHNHTSLSSPGGKGCNSLRGQFGRWTYNYSYANSSWYVPNGWIRSGELTDGPYNHSSWMYESSIPSCPVDILNLQGFCKAANTLNRTRMLVLGDSIEFMRLISFFHLMGIPSQVHQHLRRATFMKYKYVFQECQSPIELVFYRVNHFMPALGNATLNTKPEMNHTLSLSVDEQQNLRKAQFEQRIATEGVTDRRNILEYFVCYGVREPQFPDEKGWCPWVHEYLNYPTYQKTMLIGGIGPHFHSKVYFQEQLEQFINLLKTERRPDDIVWLRTVLDGHENCDDEKNPIAPLKTFEEFKENYYYGQNKRQHDWELFKIYNKILEREVMKIQMDKEWRGASFDLYDIYWMSALRRDGHPSREDCLHYLLPGPPDWWNHLFYSNLLELAKI